MGVPSCSSTQPRISTSGRGPLTSYAGISDPQLGPSSTGGNHAVVALVDRTDDVKSGVGARSFCRLTCNGSFELSPGFFGAFFAAPADAPIVKQEPPKHMASVAPELEKKQI